MRGFLRPAENANLTVVQAMCTALYPLLLIANILRLIYILIYV